MKLLTTFIKEKMKTQKQKMRTKALDVFQSLRISGHMLLSQDERLVALSYLLSIPTDQIKSDGGSFYSVDGHEYLVLTDKGADEYLEGVLQEYLYEKIYSKIPDECIEYFNETDWLKRERGDRGYHIARYDGEEHKIKDYYIYHTGYFE